VVELVDTPDLGSGAARCESSSLSARTKKKGLAKAGPFLVLGDFYFIDSLSILTQIIKL
jgi:hypothetical protein